MSWAGGKYLEGNVACISDEVYVDPKGAICISLGLDMEDTDGDGDSMDLIGLTHRLNNDEWLLFKDITLTQDE